MTTRRRLLIAFAGVHLILVACGAAGVRLFPASLPGEAVRVYGALSGADNGYGFFAPGVGPQFKTTFVMTDRNGRQWTDTLQLGESHEANLRFTGISTLLPSMGEEERQRVLQSFAAMMFGRHPKAATVVVRLELYGFERTARDVDYPTMDEFRRGVRPRWFLIFQSPPFERKAEGQ